MWILSFLPDWFFHLITLAGIVGIIAGFLLGFIPFISKYKLPIQVISILVLALGIYLEGGMANEQVWQARVKEVEAKLAKAEAESQKENVKIVQKIVTKRELVRVMGSSTVQYVDREVVKYDESCKIPQVVINAHNAAATSKPLAEKVSEFFGLRLAMNLQQ
jgi:hypothetical protein